MKHSKHIAYIAAALLLILLLPLLAGCGKSQAQYATASAEIPEGWEAVSTEGNVTHLRMKEGSDAHYWMKNRYFYQLSEDGNLPMTVEIAGNAEKAPLTPDKDGNVYFIVYFGLFYADKIDGNYQLVDAPEETEELSYSLEMENGREDIMENLWGEKMFSEPWKLDELSEYNNVALEPIANAGPGEPQAHIGLTRAVLIACPYSKLDSEWRTLIFRIEQNGNMYKEEYQSYAAWNGNVYFKSADLKADGKPLGVRWFGYISVALLLCSMILMILSAIWKKNSFLLFIPLIIGILFCAVALRYHAAFPYPDDVMGAGVAEFLMIFVYIIAGVILLVIRLLIGLIRRWICRIRQKNGETQSTESL